MKGKLTLPEVQMRFSRSEATIRKWVRTGRLKAETGSDGKLIFDAGVVASFKPPKRGRPSPIKT